VSRADQAQGNLPGLSVQVWIIEGAIRVFLTVRRDESQHGEGGGGLWVDFHDE
jgi:hypothetical protein